MRKQILTAVLLLGLGATAMAQQIHSVDVNAALRHDGSAIITQVWDATVVSGTEWYIPIENLDEMYVDSLSVEENGKQYINEGDKWKVERTLSEKKGRCGIVRKKGHDVELCWGQGSYERHQWTARFRVQGLVQSYEDYDAFNFMFINPGLVAPPQTARVVIENHADTTYWTPENTRVWAFGFYGDIHVEDGKIVATTSQSMTDESKVIIMVRFDKGMFKPTVSRDKPFEKLKKKAFENSDYNEDGTEKTFFQKASWSELLTLFGVAFCCIFFSIILPIYKLFRYWFGYLYDKKLLGLSKITEWYRAAPLENNLFAAYYVLRKGSPYTSSKATQNIVGAFFLKWILEGIIHAVPEGKKGINLVFGEHLPENTNQMSVQELELYSMAREACGDNLILEKNEFKKWSRKKYTKVTKWPDNAYAEGKSFLMSKGFLDNKGHGTETGKEEMRHVIELKNFLKDFTKIDERTAMETILWKEYLIYAQLFGIADKVSKQMAKLFPAEMEQFTQSIGTDHTTFMRALTYNSSMTSSAVLNALSKASGGSSWSSGGGGRSSYGGGGGFSGGGHGGGSR